MAGETLAGVALEIRRCLSMSPADRHEALRWVTQFIALFENAHPSRRPSMVAEEPQLTGDERWDALLAATAEHLLDQPALLALLEALAAELAATGVRGEMFIVGGAAMALAYNTRRSTRDIDVVRYGERRGDR